MRKKFLGLIITLCIVFTLIFVFPVPSFAATEGIYDYEIYAGIAGITGCNTSASGAISIPETLGGYPVMIINSKAFLGCTNLTDITIPDRVTIIGERTFSNCTNLTNITIPDGVTTIGDYAFYGCESLTNITIPDGVTSIGEWTFSACTSLTNITIPDRVTSIGECAFSDCISLTDITIPNGVTSIGVGAFSRCASLTDITIPNRVTSIGEWAFSDCISLTDITIPNGVTTIGDDAFYGCTNLTNITIPDGVTTIGDSAFYGCKNLTNIEFPDSITSIGRRAFGRCNIHTVFYPGNQEKWENIIIGPDNECLTEDEIIFNANKKNYKFVTNSDAVLPDIYGYAVYNKPTLKRTDDYATAWYDNESLNGGYITFPYYGDATTLYAAPIPRTGENYETALTAKSNNKYHITSAASVFYEFVPKETAEYRFYSEGDCEVDAQLEDSRKIRLTSDIDYNFSFSYNLTAGETYFISALIIDGDAFTLVIEGPSHVEINSISFGDSLEEIETIPKTNFTATVSFNLIDALYATPILAGYSADGSLKGIFYVNTKDVPVVDGKTNIPVDNTDGEITTLKAFCRSSLTSLNPVGNAVIFPAE